MLDVPVYNIEGEQVDTLTVDEGAFGGAVNVDLLKQAVVMYHANRRQGTAANRNRSLVSGTTAKAFRQKGTGRARRGDLRTNLLRGGGVAFRKDPRSFRKRMPKKMRRRALKSAILAKILSNDLMVLEGLAMETPRTRRMAEVLRNLQIHRSCLLTLAERDANIHLSARNIPDLTVRIVDELNAFDVATRQKMVITTEAMARLTGEAPGQEPAEAAAGPAEPADEQAAEPAPPAGGEASEAPAAAEEASVAAAAGQETAAGDEPAAAEAAGPGADEQPAAPDAEAPAGPAGQEEAES